MRSMLLGGALLGALAVLAGAFGAHALAGALDARALGWFETAARYHLAHALALVACAALAASLARADAGRGARRTLAVAAIAFALGVVLFSGSLYALALGAPRPIAAMAPIGGLCLIGGWLGLAVTALRLPRALS